MKESTKVKVVANTTGHEFRVGEIVHRCIGEHDGDYNCLAFISSETGVRYMQEHEYEIADKDCALELLVQAMNACHASGFSRDVWETASVAVDNAYREIEEDEKD